MAQSIVFNNATYIIPDVGESNWGQNLTNYFVAIASGAYQLSGGTQALTADLSFGSNFGIFSKYFTSITSTPATAGQVRLARADTIDWLNQLGNANLALAVDSSNNLTFNGNIISGSAAGPVTSIAGTANQITASAATGAVTLSTPATFIAPGSIKATTTLAAAATSSQLVLGVTNTTTISSTAPAASRVYTIPDAGGAANVVLDAGNYTIAGTWSFSNSITLASTKAIVFTDNGTSTVTLKATNATTSYTLQLPVDDGTPNQFLQTDGSGNTTWANGGAGTVVSGTAGRLTLYPSTAASVSDTYVQNSQNIVLAIAAQASRSTGLVITIPNPGNAVATANVLLSEGAQTINGNQTLAGTTNLSGLTLSTALALDASKNIVSVTNTGSGSNVLATSPTLVTPVLGAASATSISFSSTSGIIGTTTNNSAAAGSVGEVISASTLRSAGGNLSTGTGANVASISLTAGDWDVRGFVGGSLSGGTTLSSLAGAISTTSATIPGGDTLGVPDSAGQVTVQENGNTNFLTGAGDVVFTIPSTRVLISSTTTYYLVIKATFAVSNISLYGSIVARRIR